MKVILSQQLDTNIESVWSCFEQANRFKQWQPSLRRIATRGGKQSERRLLYVEGGVPVLVKERVIKREYPHYLSMSYQNGLIEHEIHHKFTTTAEGKTLWQVIARFKFRPVVFHLIARFKLNILERRLRTDMQRLSELLAVSPMSQHFCGPLKLAS